jgi:hypothetical protein
VRAGDIAVSPAPGPNPKRVAGGLIHHWMGAIFMPNLKLDDVLEVTRDYDRYKDFYSPLVINSKAIARRGPVDVFSMLLMNKALLSKVALDAEYRATNVRVDDRRFYSVSRSTRVQEIEKYARPNERKIPEGEGTGCIWKLYSIARFEQRDGGVYVELEAVALSRDIPAALRFAVDPVVRRVSRNSLLTSLQQTGDAVHERFGGTSAVSTRSRTLDNVPISPSRTHSAFTSGH